MKNHQVHRKILLPGDGGSRINWLENIGEGSNKKIKTSVVDFGQIVGLYIYIYIQYIDAYMNICSTKQNQIQIVPLRYTPNDKEE